MLFDKGGANAMKLLGLLLVAMELFNWESLLAEEAEIGLSLYMDTRRSKGGACWAGEWLLLVLDCGGGALLSTSSWSLL